MSIASSLLQNVLDDPSDEPARLVYGDALLAVGDPRGELIAIEHQWAQHRSIELAVRRAQLRREHGATWWPEVATRFVRTRCGFVEAIAVGAGDLASAARLLAREPIAEVELFDVVHPAHLEIAWPERIVRLAARSITGPALAALLSSPLGGRLESLDIAGAWTDEVEWGAALPRCTRLNVARSSVRIERLLSWAHWDGLRELDLSCSEFDEWDLQKLLARVPRALQVLILSRSDLGESGANALAESLELFPELVRLELIGADLGERGAARLRACCPAGLAIAFSPADLERTLELDFVGGRLELSPAQDGAWTISCDGVPRLITVREFELYSIGGPSLRSETTGDTGRLGDLVEAIAMSSPRKLTARGISVDLGPLRYDPAGAIVSADLRVPDDDAPIEIEIESYID